jgi:hypothetical protein
MDKPLARAAVCRGKGHHTYRKMLNSLPMRDGGTVSDSKFTSRIHQLFGAGRDEAPLRDSSKYRALPWHELVTGRRIRFGDFYRKFLF